MSRKAPIGPRRGLARLNVLVVYSGFPTRATLRDGLFAFRRYSGERVFYLNLRIMRVPRYVTKIKFDLIIFHTLFFAGRFDREFLRRSFRRAAPLAKLDAVKVILPQDEFINSEAVNDFIRDFGIDCIFSVQPEAVWDDVYRGVDRNRVAIRPILTGYLDDDRAKKIEALAATAKRDIDIGYRTAGDAPAWFGRHGFLKRVIAERFVQKGAGSGLRLDISTSARHTLMGDDWYRFLARCKYTLGVEGGTSILDRDGSIRLRTEAYQAAHPDATFEELERACFPGVDGTFSGFAISPRHLEACAARACQILTEGHYNGILEPGKHYIAVKRDFSNVSEIIDLVRSDTKRDEIVARAHRDIVESGIYTNRKFVQFVLAESMAARKAKSLRGSKAKVVTTATAHAWMRLVESAMVVLTFGRSRMPAGKSLRQVLRLWSK